MLSVCCVFLEPPPGRLQQKTRFRFRPRWTDFAFAPAYGGLPTSDRRPVGPPSRRNAAAIPPGWSGLLPARPVRRASLQNRWVGIDVRRST